MAEVHVWLGTKSDIKVKACVGAFERAFEGRTVVVHPVGAQSGVAEQPIGHKETLQGALNRLAGCKAGVEEEQLEGARDCFFCAVENGVVPVELGDEERVFLDLAWVVVERASDGRQGRATSGGVLFPAAAVAAAEEVGFDKCTVGSMLDVEDSKDPHRSLTAGLQPRVELLRGAFLCALGGVLVG